MSDTSGMTDALSNHIRAVDGSHSLGAGALAEKIMEFFQPIIDELDALRQEVERQADLLQDKFTRETLITGIDVTNGGLMIGTQGGAAKILAESFAAMFKDGGGVNYLEMTFKSTEIAPDESFVVTVRHCAGKTPHTLRAEAEADRDRLAAEVLRLQGERDAMANKVNSFAGGLYSWSEDSTLSDEVRRVLFNYAKQLHAAALSPATTTGEPK